MSAIKSVLERMKSLDEKVVHKNTQKDMVDCILQSRKGLKGWEAKKFDEYVKMIHNQMPSTPYKNTEDSLRTMDPVQIMRVASRWKMYP